MQKPPQIRVVQQVAVAFADAAKALSSPPRVALMMLVAQCPRSVETLAGLTEASVAIVSHHLGALRRVGLLRAEKRGRESIHHVADAAWPVLRALLEFVAATSPDVRLGVGELYLPDSFDLRAAGEVEAAVAAGEALVLDVRFADEYAHAHYPGARGVPLPTLAETLAALPRDRELLCYARGRFCPLSELAVRLLRAHGFRARRWAAGVVEMRSAGIPLTRD